MSATKGFTLVEVIIVMTVSGILSGLLFGPLNDLYNSNVSGIQKVIQTSGTRAALRFIEKDISSSVAFASTNSLSGNALGAADPEGAGGTSWYWRAGDASKREAKLITINYMTAKNGSDRTLAYTAATCNDTIDSPKPLYTNTIYYLKNNALYRRVLLQTTSTCLGYVIDQRQSCTSPGTTAGCTATDAKIVDNVSEFRVDYYAESDSPSKLPTTDDTTPGSAKTLMLRLATTAGAGTNVTGASTSLRVTRINQYE